MFTWNNINFHTVLCFSGSNFHKDGLQDAAMLVFLTQDFLFMEFAFKYGMWE